MFHATFLFPAGLVKLEEDMRALCWFACFAAAAAWASDCTKTSVGCPPLNGPYFRMYQGTALGLYPNNTTVRPAAHEAAGQEQLAQVLPRDGSGNPNIQAGKIVLLSIGMSNATQEFSAFKQIADRDGEKDRGLVIVDGAQGGWSADRIVADPTTYWNNVEQRLTMAGVTDQQVQVAWLKEADASPNQPFPADAQTLESQVKTMVVSLRPRFPNLRLLYVSSRIYAGYATTPLNPEPYAYESGFAYKWLIESQINGSDPGLDFGSGKAPWLAWGPYLWADGTNMRFDGLSWACSDLSDDGTHPSTSGRLKVARMLLDFFKGDSTARPWFTGNRLPSPQTPAVSAVTNAASYITVVATGAIASIFGTDLAARAATAPAFPLPYGLAGTSVIVGGQLAPLYAVSPTQINFVVPPGLNDTTLVVIRDGVASNTVNIQTGLYTEGLFTLDYTGSGPVAARHADGRVVNAQAPAAPGEVVELYGTGRGVRNPLLMIPDVLPMVKIGGVAADVTYYGQAPGTPGMDQINVRIPASAPAGVAVPLQVQLGSFLSNQVTIAVGSL